MTVEDFRTSLAEGLFILDSDNPDEAKVTLVTSSSNILELPQGFITMVRHTLASQYLWIQKAAHLIDESNDAEKLLYVEMMSDADIVLYTRRIFRVFHDCMDKDLEVFLNEI